MPRKFEHVPISDFIPQEASLTNPTNQPSSEGFLNITYVALKMRGDILAHTKFTGFVVSEDKMIKCVVENLFLCIRLMLGGPNLLENDPKEEEFTLEGKEADTKTRVLNIAQKPVYNVTGGKHWTPSICGLPVPCTKKHKGAGKFVS